VDKRDDGSVSRHIVDYALSLPLDAGIWKRMAGSREENALFADRDAVFGEEEEGGVSEASPWTTVRDHDERKGPLFSLRLIIGREREETHLVMLRSRDQSLLQVPHALLHDLLERVDQSLSLFSGQTTIRSGGESGDGRMGVEVVCSERG
jgi:hypothetical protein